MYENYFFKFYNYREWLNFINYSIFLQLNFITTVFLNTEFKNKQTNKNSHCCCYYHPVIISGTCVSLLGLP